MKKQIGVVGVDSGTLIILDPCNIEDKRLKCLEENLSDFIINDKQASQLNYTTKHPGLAVVFSSGMGDGLYPVFAHYSDGKITKIEIVF